MPVECEVAPLARGLLKSDIRPDERVLRWFEPSAALAPFVQRIWSAQWRIPAGEHRVQPILPHPSANLVLGRGTADILGVVTRAAIQPLDGVGSAFGAKLQPGALRAFGVERPSLIRDKCAPAADLLAGPPLRRMSEDPEAIAREIESYLLAHASKHDAISLKVREIVELAENDREIVSVSRLAHALRLSVRSVQDICQRALGVSPKWLIRCFRLQDALARLGVGSDVNLSAFAQELGYFDQAHFTRDFKRVTGVSAGRYYMLREPAESNGFWLKLSKIGALETTISKDEAIEAALCCGWIDGQLAKFDEHHFLIRMTPRRSGSRWSAKNRGTAERLAREGRLKAPGLGQIAQAKADGRWDAAYQSQGKAEVPSDLLAALAKNAKAARFFETLDRANRYAMIYRVNDAKRQETRRKRIAQYVDMLARGETIHPQKSAKSRPRGG